MSLAVYCSSAFMKTFTLWLCRELSSSIPIQCRMRWSGRCWSRVNILRNKVNGSLFASQGFLSGFASAHWRATGEDAGSCHLCVSFTTPMSRAGPFQPCSWSSLLPWEQSPDVSGTSHAEKQGNIWPYILQVVYFLHCPRFQTEVLRNQPPTAKTLQFLLKCLHYK